MKIINQILLLSLILVMSCDDNNESFSIIGTWEMSYRSEGETNWNKTETTWKFNSDGSVIENNMKDYYYFCESENFLQFGSNRFDETCECKTSTTISTFGITIDGSDTFYLNDCSDNFQSLKLVKQ